MCVQDVDARLHTYSPQALASFTWALAVWAAPPSQLWLAKVLALFSHRMAAAGGPALLQMAGALVALRGVGCRQLPKSFLTQLCMAADAAKATMAPAQLASLLLALGQLLGYSRATGPSREGSSNSHVGSDSSGSSHGDDSMLSSTISTISNGSRSKELRQRCICSMLETLTAALDKVDTAETAVRAAAAAAACSAVLEPHDAAALLSATRRHLPQLTGPQLLALAHCAAQLSCRPPPLPWQAALLYAFEHQLRWTDLQHQHLPHIQAALSALCMSVPEHWAVLCACSNSDRPGSHCTEAVVQLSHACRHRELDACTASADVHYDSAAVAILLAPKHTTLSV